MVNKWGIVYVSIVDSVGVVAESTIFLLFIII